MSFLHLNNHPPIKYGVDPAPVPLNGDAAVDNIQDLLRRKRELEKNKSKFRLSEADCNLLLTNANEYYFKDKQVVVHEGQELPSVYRLKSGNLNIVKNGKIVSSISQGWFLGETIFLNGRSCVYDATLIADGPVTMCELNFEFVSKLFEVDYVLALKFYRTLSSKLAAVCYALMGHLLGSCFESISKSQSPLLYFNNNFPVPSSFSPTRNTPSHSVSSDSSDSPDSSSSSSIARSRSSTFIPTASITAIATPAKSRMVVNAAKLSQCPNLPDSFLLEAVNRRKRLSKSKSMSNLHLPFKVYSLETNSKGLLGCKLKRTKICIVSEPFGFKNKVSIEYTKIKNIVRTTEKSITIIYNNFQAKTLFFKSKEDAEEFSGLSLQLVEATTHEIRKSTSGSPISSPTLAISGRTVSFSGEFPPFLDNDLNSSDSKISSGSDEASSSNNSNNLKNSRNSFSDSHQDEDLTTTLMSLSTTEELRKGDFLLREGDLFQRIYTIVSGTFVAMVNGHALKEMGPGEVMGIPSLLHLRPCPVSIRVDSETASVRVLPAYKINEVANANLQLSSRLYKRAATTLQTQIEEILMKYQALTIDVGSYGDNSNNDNNNKDTSPVSSPPTTPKQKGPVSPRAAVVQQP